MSDTAKMRSLIEKANTCGGTGYARSIYVEQVFDMAEDAADEIERLRAELHAARITEQDAAEYDPDRPLPWMGNNEAVRDLVHAVTGVDPTAGPCEPRCEQEYCGGCAMAECPHGEPLHRHHDGCPACSQDDEPPTEIRARLEWFIEGWGAACVGHIPADVASGVLREAATEIDRLLTLARKVDAIRNSIIGGQTFNWSEHAYPLVAALGEAGFEGQGYEIARANLGTLIEQINTVETERDALRAELEAARRRGERLEAALVRCDVWISTLEAPRLPRGDRDVMVTLIRAALEEKP